jgi:hypothetical protein
MGGMSAGPGTARWRIDLGDRADVTFQLRDYFRRLGVDAEVRGRGGGEVTTTRDAVGLGQLRADWVGVVDVPARFVGRPQPAQLAAKPVPRLGSLLVTKGFLTEARLELALNEARETGELLGLLLLRKQWIFEDELARTLSEQLLIPYVSVGRIGVDEAVARRVPHELGERVAAIPVRLDGDAVQVAFADPTDPAAVEAVAAYVDQISVAVAELTDIRLAWRSVGRVAAAGTR